MARMNAQQAAEVAKALARQNDQATTASSLPAVSGPGGIAGGIFRGKAKEATSASGGAGLASAYVETARTWGDASTELATRFTSDGLFAIGMVPVKTITLAESDASGNAITGTSVTITLSGKLPS